MKAFNHRPEKTAQCRRRKHGRKETEGGKWSENKIQTKSEETLS